VRSTSVEQELNINIATIIVKIYLIILNIYKNFFQKYKKILIKKN